MAALLDSRWLHPLLLLVWLAIGISVRFTNLTAKPPWTDEFSTLVFSLGNSFLPVPLDQLISVDTLLQPLIPQKTADVNDVLLHLFTESNHPPLYFVLAHWWMQLFPTVVGLVSLWGARSLAAFLGAASIPAMYTLSWLAFRSRVASHLTAAMMAISPFGIFLAQEARHYTLAILWVIASLACLIIAIRHIQNRTQIPIWIALAWVSINALGIATHYFFTLTLCVEALVLIVIGWQRFGDLNIWEKSRFKFPPTPWGRICVVAASTFVASLVWLPVFLNSRGNLTDWIQAPRSGFTWISPIFQAIAAWATMIYLLPVEASQLAVVVISGLVMLIFFIWAAPIVVRGIKINLAQPQTRLMTLVFSKVVISAIGLFFIFTYCFGIDLTRGARYNFVYFPAVVVLVGASLAVCWNSVVEIGKWGISGKKAVAVILLMGLLSAITVVYNLGYQKYYRPDLFVQLIQKTSHVPVLISTTHKTHVQTGEMMGIAREFKIHEPPSQAPLFLLAHQDKDSSTSTIALQKSLKLLPRPVDLWLVNFQAKIPQEVKNCLPDTQSLPAVDGYEYKLYHCQQ